MNYSFRSWPILPKFSLTCWPKMGDYKNIYSYRTKSQGAAGYDLRLQIVISNEEAQNRKTA
jgi:hypothetical protein